MHYHYFTLEQREALSRQILGMKAGTNHADAASALEPLRAADYGVCEACEADIPFVSLLENPFQRLCRRCTGR